jgi:hypothetical protein
VPRLQAVLNIWGKANNRAPGGRIVLEFLSERVTMESPSKDVEEIPGHILRTQTGGVCFYSVKRFRLSNYA